MGEIQEFDIIICGAGPGGSTCAQILSDSGAKIALVEKGVFPRDKICGDGLTHDVINQLGWLPNPIQEEFYKKAERHTFTGVHLYAPDGTRLSIPMKLRGNEMEAWFVPRMEFDNFLFKEATKSPNVTAIEDAKVTDVKVLPDGVEVTTSKGTLRGKMVVGAEGAHSVVARKLANYEVEHKHHAAGLRRYYENVSGLNPEGYMEIHLCPSIQPGYLWIFPLPNNKFNVGLGMLSSERVKQGTNLREEFENLIQTDPNIAPKFKDAKPLEPTRGMGLPLGTQKRSISGERFVLLGDAAGLIDPFTGEGVGNAIRSGRFAAPVIEAAYKANDYSAKKLSAYEKRVRKAMDGEFRRNGMLQHLQVRHNALNWVIKKLKDNPSGQKWMRYIIDGEPMRGQWFNPFFYLRALLK